MRSLRRTPSENPFTVMRMLSFCADTAAWYCGGTLPEKRVKSSKKLNTDTIGFAMMISLPDACVDAMSIVLFCTPDGWSYAPFVQRVDVFFLDVAGFFGYVYQSVIVR